MKIYCRQTAVLGLLISVILTSTLSFAGPVGEKNLLISTQGTVYEYTRDGTLVQSFPVPYPGEIPEDVRDIVLDDSGNVVVYNGTFNPFLSSFDPLSTTWTHTTHIGWSTVGNEAYGGIATIDQYIFVTDMRTFGDSGADEAKGIIRFDLQNNSSERFATDIEPKDLNIGLDGLLYALFPGGTPGGTSINVYDPFSLSFIRSIDLTITFGWNGNESVAINANGDIFVADWFGNLHRIDSNGNLLSTINLCAITSYCNLYDVDISADGLVVLGTRFGEVIITNVNFSEVNNFSVGSGAVFVSVVPLCLEPNLSPTVVIDGCETGVSNFVIEGGCSIMDLITECGEDAMNHGQFKSCVDHLARDLKRDGVITGREKGKISSCADKADIP